MSFQNTTRGDTRRATWWDYGSQAVYFITICTRDREYFFGDVIEGNMQLSEIRKVAESEWLRTPMLRPDMNLLLDEFVFMPNHFHAILEIKRNPFNHRKMNNRDTSLEESSDAMPGVEHIKASTTVNRFQPQAKNLSSVIRGFKSGVTVYARENNIDFEWQARFHDHIIKDEKSYFKIKNYIRTNPQNWEEDMFRK